MGRPPLGSLREIMIIVSSILFAACHSTTIPISPECATFKSQRFAYDTNIRRIDQKLIDAVKSGKGYLVKQLIKKGANPNMNIANGWRLLLELSGPTGQQFEMAKILIAKGAKVNYCQPDQGYTPLTSAIQNGGPGSDPSPLVKFLIQKGANVDAPMEDGLTALHLAVARGQVKVVQLLLANKANVNARTLDSKRPEKAKEQRDRLLKTLTTKQAEMYLLTEQSDLAIDKKMHQEAEAMIASAYARMFEPGFHASGLTPLMEMVEIGMTSSWNQEIVNLLIAAGASIKGTDDNGWTMLHLAAKAGNLVAAKALIHMGLDVNAPSHGGFRPLHIAMRAGYNFPHKAMTELLLQNHADRSLKNNLGQTPLDLLVADSDWFFREEQNNPNARMGAEMRDRYLAIVNSVMKLLDPKANLVTLSSPVIDAKGTRYKSLEIVGVQFHRAVRVENGKTILELWIEDEVSGSRQVTLKDLELNHYEPLVDQPIQVKLQKGERIIVPFPREAAFGGAVSVKFDEVVAGGSGSSSGNLNEGPSDDFCFSSSPSSNFKGIDISHGLANTVVIFHVDKITIKGKEQKQFAGLELRVKGGKAMTIPGLISPMEGNNLVIVYRYRVSGNKKWKSETVPFR